MSSRIDLAIRPSAGVGCLVALPWAGLGMFNLILALTYSLWFLALIPLALAGGIYQWKLNGRLGLQRSVVRLTVNVDQLQLQHRNGQKYPVRADPSSRLYPRLAILKLMPSDTTNRPSTVLLWADRADCGDSGSLGNVPADQHRQLRAWLRLGPSSEQRRHNH
ncbi:hypothetical protein [Marinobacter confluentis]|uniref:Uncharacterized protein n=1 Tax=Marinobacter confluentis TaxID=1697557 RepID=A0A4Z1C1A4_9GAMM|nr:hypothetical protein [Marinobacter confluentis]TGN41038.1 hypothetical protein E5Q11_00335 [Marinobacter confluentis]